MADIVKTVQDGLGMSVVSDPDGMVRPPINEGLTISLSILPSGIHKDLVETLNLSEFVSPSGSKVYIDSDLMTVSEQYLDPSGVVNPHAAGENVLINTTNNDGSSNSNSIDESMYLSSTEWDQGDLISISLPLSSSYPKGYSLQFQCSATYGEGGDIEDENVIWISNIDGVFHRGKSFYYKGLSVGSHTIECRIYDNVNVLDSVEISIIENTTDQRVEGLREE